MKKTIYVAWFAYDDFWGCAWMQDTIRSRAFSTKESMLKWIDKLTNRVLKEYGVSKEDYDNGDVNKLAIYWDFKKQKISF